MNILLTIIKLLPAIIEAVKQAEYFASKTGVGGAKLEFVLGVVQDVYPDAATILETIAKVVSRIVELANKTGIFNKS